MAKHFTKFAFTDSVKEVQKQYGTRHAYEKMEENDAPREMLTLQEKTYIQKRDSFYMASVGENGWPYLQFRGGPKGFLKDLDDNTLGFADFRGNGQYISAGNLIHSKKTVLFLMDYPKQQRLKIWAEADVLHAEDHPDLLKKVLMPDYEAKAERIFTFKVLAFDWNCPQHISQKYTTEEIKEGIAKSDPHLLESCCPKGIE